MKCEGPMIHTAVLRACLPTLFCLAAGAVVAADTISCESLDGRVTADLDVAFASDKAGGSVVAVRAATPDFALSTDEGETLAFSEVAYDRISAGLESPNVGPMTFTVDIVRTADALPGDGPESGVVVAGVARIAGFGTTILTCRGW